MLLRQTQVQQPKKAPSPLVLEKREKIFTADAGYRSRLPEDVLREYAHLIGRSGIIEELERAYRDPCDLVHVYVARFRTDFAGGSERRLRKKLRAPCAGKGMTEAQAQVSALGEAVERYSAIFRGDEVRIKASYRELSSEAIHPNACMNFSARQYREREKWNQREAEFNWVPQPFDDERETEWTPVWSLTEERFKYAATASCYFGYPFSPEHDFCRPDSNGNAAGNLEEAILQGFLEVVERDAVALWWYNSARRPRVELASFEEPYFEALAELYRILGREMHVLDISADLSIPAFAAVSRGRKDERDFLLGFGAHLDPRIAIARALTEMNTFLATAIAGEFRRIFVGDPFEHAFLVPDVLTPIKTRRDYAPFQGEDLREDVRVCVELASKRGLETLVLDQTRSDVRMRAVKVIVPGMRPWWARFAPGRLYQVPVEMGWQAAPLSQEQLNPCHLAV